MDHDLLIGQVDDRAHAPSHVPRCICDFKHQLIQACVEVDLTFKAAFRPNLNCIAKQGERGIRFGGTPDCNRCLSNKIVFLWRRNGEIWRAIVMLQRKSAHLTHLTRQAVFANGGHARVIGPHFQMANLKMCFLGYSPVIDHRLPEDRIEGDF